MSDSTFKIIYEGGQGELVEKKSRFIATIIPVTSEQEAVDFIAAKKKEYWDAKHNCSAFVIGDNNEITRCNDDGEPAQTAGRPMLDVLLRENIHNCAVVVTRYFGGVLLGTGGLVRAYQGAVAEGLKNCIIINPTMGAKAAISTDYNGYGKIEYILREAEIPIMETEYGADVVVNAMVPVDQKAALEKAIADKTAGQAKIEWSDEVKYALIENCVKIL